MAIEAATHGPFRDTTPPSSEYWEACARDTNPKNRPNAPTCLPLRRMRPPFDLRGAERSSADISRRDDNRLLRPVQREDGCDSSSVVRLRHLLERHLPSKDVCRVRSRPAIRSSNITPYFGTFICEEKEKVRLEPYARAAKTKKQAAAVGHARFYWAGANKPLFHIELKTGPGSIDAMSEFQLDINDSNDIIGAMKYTGLPHTSSTPKWSTSTPRPRDIVSLVASGLQISGRCLTPESHGRHDVAKTKRLATTSHQHFNQLRSLPMSWQANGISPWPNASAT